MLRAAKAAHEVRTSSQFGIVGGEKLSPDFTLAMERVHRIRGDISRHDAALRFKEELGVDVFFGVARFAGENSIYAGEKLLHFKKAAICTGARAAAPPIPGIEESGYLTNETVFSQKECPQRLAIIGGGPIGCELAQAFARLGSKVTLIEQGKRLLPREDPDAAALVENSLLRDGISICLETSITNVVKRGNRKLLLLAGNTNSELEVDEILSGVGRVPNVDGLDLEQAGIKYDHQGVWVDNRLQTSNRRVYAAGDICSPYKFTHTADALARIVIANALFMGRQRSSELIIPWCTYTDPEVAHVGMYAQDAKQNGIEVLTLTLPLREVDRAIIDGESEGFARIHLKKGSDKILGATIVGRHAGNVINEITLAMTAGVGLSTIGKTIHPYPTQGEAVKKLADMYSRTRLTPFLQKVLAIWLKWQRT